MASRFFNLILTILIKQLTVLYVRFVSVHLDLSSMYYKWDIHAKNRTLFLETLLNITFRWSSGPTSLSFFVKSGHCLSLWKVDICWIVTQVFLEFVTFCQILAESCQHWQRKLPPVGIEPTTSWSSLSCSANWAKSLFDCLCESLRPL